KRQFAPQLRGGLDCCCPRPFNSFGYEAVDDCSEVSGLFEDPQLSIGARAVFQDVVDVFDLPTAVQLINDIIDEFEEFQDQVSGGYLLLLTEVYKLSIKAPPDGPPLILLYESAAVEPEPHVLPVQFVQLGDYRLEQRRNGNNLIDFRRNITNPEFK